MTPLGPALPFSALLPLSILGAAGGLLAYHLFSKKGFLMPHDRLTVGITDDHRFRVQIATPRAIHNIVTRWIARTNSNPNKAPKPVPHVLYTVTETAETIDGALSKVLLRFAEECLRLPDDDAIELDLAEARGTIARLEGELKTARELCDVQRTKLAEAMENDRIANAHLMKNQDVLSNVRERLTAMWNHLNGLAHTRHSNVQRLRAGVAAVRDDLQIAIDRIDEDSK